MCGCACACACACAVRCAHQILKIAFEYVHGAGASFIPLGRRLDSGQEVVNVALLRVRSHLLQAFLCLRNRLLQLGKVGLQPGASAQSVTQLVRRGSSLQLLQSLRGVRLALFLRLALRLHRFALLRAAPRRPSGNGRGHRASVGFSALSSECAWPKPCSFCLQPQPSAPKPLENWRANLQRTRKKLIVIRSNLKYKLNLLT